MWQCQRLAVSSGVGSVGHSARTHKVAGNIHTVSYQNSVIHVYDCQILLEINNKLTCLQLLTFLPFVEYNNNININEEAPLFQYFLPQEG